MSTCDPDQATMRACVLGDSLQLVEDYPRPRPGPGEALIHVRVAGICNTDLELLRGYLQFRGVPGHEFVGEVESAPDAPDWEGCRVVGEINVPCGDCPTCRAGRQTHCPKRNTLGLRERDGAFAEYLTLPLSNLHVVPDTTPDETAVFTEPLAAACEILEQVSIRPTDRVVLLGDGKLGLLCAQVLAQTECDLTVVGHHPEHLRFLIDRGIAAALEEQRLRRGAGVVVEATGAPEGFAAAMRLVRPRGTIVLKSTYHETVQANLTQVVVDEVTVIGSRCGPFAPALRILEERLVEVTSLIHARYPLSEALAAFEHASRPGVLKVLLTVP